QAGQRLLHPFPRLLHHQFLSPFCHRCRSRLRYRSRVLFHVPRWIQLHQRQEQQPEAKLVRRLAATAPPEREKQSRQAVVSFWQSAWVSVPIEVWVAPEAAERKTASSRSQELQSPPQDSRARRSATALRVVEA